MFFIGVVGGCGCFVVVMWCVYVYVQWFDIDMFLWCWLLLMVFLFVMVEVIGVYFDVIKQIGCNWCDGIYCFMGDVVDYVMCILLFYVQIMWSR